MQRLDYADRIQIIWDIKNIDEPTKSSINDYIYHGFGKIDGYLKSFFEKSNDYLIIKVQIERKGKWNIIWSLFFDFPWVFKDIEARIDENTPEENLPQAVALLFEKAKNALSKQVDKLHDRN